MRHINAIAAAAALLVSANAMARPFYFTEAAFNAQLVGPSYTEDFSGFTFGSPLDGTQANYASPGANGYSWDATSPGNTLYSNNSTLSTNTSNFPLVITMTGGTVTAIGGNYTNTDISGNQIAGTITVTLSDGSVDVSPSNPSGFLGYTSALPLTSITIAATGATNNWPQVDHFTVGSAVPEPTALGLIGLGIVGALRRRRA